MAIYMYMVEHQVSMTGPPVQVSDKEVVDTLVRVFLEGIQNRD